MESRPGSLLVSAEDLPLEKINNSALKLVVTRLRLNGLRPSVEAEMKSKGKSESDIEKMKKKPLSVHTIRNIVQLATLIVASAVNEEGVKLHPRQWNHKFMGLPKLNKKTQNTPCFTSKMMAILANYCEQREQMLFILLGACGARIGEMLGVEIKHISNNFRTISIEQQVRKCKVMTKLKTASADRQVDLPLAVAAMLRAFVGTRTTGFLFESRTGGPLDTSTIVRGHLHPVLKTLGYVNPITLDHRAGFHAFRRYRNTFLRNHTPCPEGLRKFWLGHAKEDMGDLYDKVSEDGMFRLEMAEKCGIGFDLPLLSPVYPDSENSEIVHLADNTDDGWFLGGA